MKNFLNKKQKRIVYRNIGILFSLTIVCAILARCGVLTGKETLEDLAKRQKPTSSIAVPADIVPAANFSIKEERHLQDTAFLSSETESTPSQENDIMEDRVIYQEDFYYESLSDTIKKRITGISYPDDDSNAAISYNMLRYVNVLYYDFNGNSQNGELICHKDIAQDIVEIFYELYKIRYPIEKITLIDTYQGDDELSMQDNNTSCFNYRTRPSGKLSNHAYGLAIDLNPFYNPYIMQQKNGTILISPAESKAYANREHSFAYKIDKEDPAYLLFIQHGFTWGGSWNSVKDYQHFEKTI